MLSKKNQVEIHVLHRQGKSIREIARETGASRNTIRAVLRGEAHERYGPRRPMPSILDTHKDHLRFRLKQAGEIHLDATVLHREIAQRGYCGSIDAGSVRWTRPA